MLKRLSPYGADYSIGHTLATNSDLMREICNVEATLPFTFNQQHVKSHQFDNEHDSAQIPLPNLLNKQCDLIAEVAYTCSTCTNPAPCPPFPTTTAYLRYNSQILTEHITKKLRFVLQDNHLKSYILSKTAWSFETIDNISWQFMALALRHITGKRRKAYIKMTHQLWATNKQQAKQSKQRHDTSRCPR